MACIEIVRTTGAGQKGNPMVSQCKMPSNIRELGFTFKSMSKKPKKEHSCP